MDKLRIGKRIKTLRINIGIKQKDLAKKLKISSNYLSIIENGKRQPGMKFLNKLALVLRIPMEYFFLPSEEEVSLSSKKQTALYKQILFMFGKIYAEENKDKNEKAK